MLKKYFKDFKIEKICLLVISLFIFFTMYYYDNQIIFLSTQNTMHQIISGKWYFIFNGWEQPYGIILQLMCAVWALPTFILSELGVITYECVAARLWYKLFVATFLLLNTHQLDRLCKNLKFSDTKREWLKLFFLSSLLVLLPAVHIAQVDAVYLYFALLGLNYYLEDRHWHFLICFMFAVAGKYMPLFIFIPLILLKEKRYLYIIRDLFVGSILILFDKLMHSIGYRLEIFLGADVYTKSNSVLESNINSLLHSNINVFDVQMSAVALLFALLCIWCYVKDSKLHKDLAVFVSFIGFAILFSFGRLEPYWIILIMPFMLVLIFNENEHFNILFILELLFSIGYLYIFTLEVSWIFGSENTFSFLLFSLIPGYTNNIHGYIADFVRARGLEIFDGLMSAMMLACLIGITFIAYPLKNSNKQNTPENPNTLRICYWIRILMILSWIFLNIWVVAFNNIW